jgi:hypothetical protein
VAAFQWLRAGCPTDRIAWARIAWARIAWARIAWARIVWSCRDVSPNLISPHQHSLLLVAYLNHEIDSHRYGGRGQFR